MKSNELRRRSCCGHTLWRQFMLCSHTLEAVHAVLTHSEIRKWDLLEVGEAGKAIF